MPGDIFMSQLGGGWRTGEGSVPLCAQNSLHNKELQGPVSVVLKRRDLAMSSAHLREVH